MAPGWLPKGLEHALRLCASVGGEQGRRGTVAGISKALRALGRKGLGELYICKTWIWVSSCRDVNFHPDGPEVSAGALAVQDTAVANHGVPAA